MIVGDPKDRPDQHLAAEIDFGAGDDATGLVGDEDTETAELLLRGDGSTDCGEGRRLRRVDRPPAVFSISVVLGSA